jgi:protein-glutamine gamma-glutamyltransferase
MNSLRLLIGLGIGIFMVGLELEGWVLSISLIFLIWKSALELWHLQKPPRWFINALVIVFLGILGVRYRSIFSQEASSSFLILLASLKLLEERTLRDQKFLFLLGFVLISALFLFSLEVPALVGGMACFFFLWSAQSREIKYSSMFLRSLPLALFLFLFFPRVQNPFGLQGLTSSQGSTGFSDELNPGSISRIQNSKEVAFRVQFVGDKKYRPRDQYWRGQVLTFSEGLRWTNPPVPTLERVFEKLQRVDYEVALEPQGKRWLFAWEPTDGLQTNRIPFLLKHGPYYESVAPIYERLTYQGRIGEDVTPTAAEKSDLQIPEVPAHVTELVRTFALGTKNREAVAENILNYFRAQKFIYTKTPGGASASLEAFLLQGKKGYCEHYAASFATLLRLAGIPARVVTGYQGGEYNTYGNFWKFTQADAHAWTEYLDETGHWVRVDPTSAVAPERLELGGVLFEDLPEEWVGQNRAQEYLKTREAWWIQARETVLQNVESLNYDLVLFLIDFNLEKQKEIFRDYRYWVLGGGTALLLIFLLQSFYRRDRRTYAQWLLAELEKKAEKQNLHREVSETLRQFITRWSQKRPDLRETLTELLAIYEMSEYAMGTPKHSPPETRALLKSLRN